MSRVRPETRTRKLLRFLGVEPGWRAGAGAGEGPNLAGLRQELFDRALRVALVLGFFTLLVGAYKSIMLSRPFVLFIYVAFYAGLAVLHVSGRWVSFRRRLFAGWGFLYVLSVLVLLRFGLSGSGIALLFGLTMLSTFLLGVRAGLLTGAVCAVTIALAGIGMTMGWIAFDTDVWLNSLSPSSWFQGTGIFVMLAAVAVLGPGALFVRLERAARDERAKSEALALANERLQAEKRARQEAEDKRDELAVAFRHAQKMEAVGRLAGGVAHDFNNLLTGITCNVSMLQEDMSQDGPTTELLEEVAEAAERATAVTGQLLAFSRKQFLVPQVLDLNELIDRLSRMLTRLIGERIALQLVPTAELACVEVDPSQIEQVVVNLVINACDAMGEGGTLTIETDNVTLDEESCASFEDVAPGHYVRLSVTDDGCGMEPDVQERVFDPFFTTKKEGVGTGLGLSTVYGILKQHGGHIDLWSEPDCGSRFEVFLPAVDALPDGEPAADSPVPGEGGGRAVLVVEDDPLVRRSALRALERRGYIVHEADCAEQALEMLAGDGLDVDLLLTDVVMPGLNGRELAERCRRERPELKVLFTSGYTEDVVARHGISDSTLDFIAKPYSPQALCARVRSALDA